MPSPFFLLHPFVTPPTGGWVFSNLSWNALAPKPVGPWIESVWVKQNRRLNVCSSRGQDVSAFCHLQWLTSSSPRNHTKTRRNHTIAIRGNRNPRRIYPRAYKKYRQNRWRFSEEETPNTW